MIDYFIRNPVVSNHKIINLSSEESVFLFNFKYL